MDNHNDLGLDASTANAGDERRSAHLAHQAATAKLPAARQNRDDYFGEQTDSASPLGSKDEMGVDEEDDGGEEVDDDDGLDGVWSAMAQQGRARGRPVPPQPDVQGRRQPDLVPLRPEAQQYVDSLQQQQQEQHQSAEEVEVQEVPCTYGAAAADEGQQSYDVGTVVCCAPGCEHDKSKIAPGGRNALGSSQCLDCRGWFHVVCQDTYAEAEDACGCVLAKEQLLRDLKAQAPKMNSDEQDAYFVKAATEARKDKYPKLPGTEKAEYGFNLGFDVKYRTLQATSDGLPAELQANPDAVLGFQEAREGISRAKAKFAARKKRKRTDDRKTANDFLAKARQNREAGIDVDHGHTEEPEYCAANAILDVNVALVTAATKARLIHVLIHDDMRTPRDLIAKGFGQKRYVLDDKPSRMNPWEAIAELGADTNFKPLNEFANDTTIQNDRLKSIDPSNPFKLSDKEVKGAVNMIT